jgi:hypothetical protein
MAPSSYGAAPWQKVFCGTLFGGLSVLAAFLLRQGEDRVQSKLDPKVARRAGDKSVDLDLFV